MKYVILLTTLVFYTSCTTPKKEYNINGYWIQEGYGIYLEVSDSTYKMYDITEISCQPSASGSVSNWSGPLNILLDLYSVSEINAASMVLRYGITSYKFNRLKSPLKRCDPPLFASDDPKLNFDIFWHTFKENYAYSKIRDVDWDAIYIKNAPLITKETTQVALFGYIAEILNAIDDQHISLNVPDSITNAYLAKNTPLKVQKKPSEIKEKEKPVNRKMGYKNPRVQAMSKITSIFPEVRFKSFHKDLIRWGKLKENIGYVQINSMNGFSQQITVNEHMEHHKYWKEHWRLVFENIDRGQTLGAYLRDEVNGARAINKQILDEFSDTSGLIIDLRFNPGGTDKVALEFLSSFIDGTLTAFTKKVWYKGQSKFKSMVSIPQSAFYYPGKIVVLTSPQTGSSAETFVLASCQLPNFTRVGTNTMGIFSDVLQKKLPNGWGYGLSNEIYESNHGMHYEYTGIPPNYKIEYPKAWYPFHASIIALKDHDPAIDLSLSILTEKLEVNK